MQLRLATVNDDFATAASNVPTVAPDHDVIFVQEGKRTAVDPLLGSAWGVHQDMDTEATQGTAVAWRRGSVKVTKTGLTFGADAADTLERSGAWVRGVVRSDPVVPDDDVRVFLMSWHRLPLRDKHLWPVQDARLADRVDNALDAGRVVIVGMDANQANPLGLAERCGLKWVAPDRDSIDGFLVSRGLRLTSVCRLAAGSSDHRPVSAIAHIEAL